MVTLSEVKKPQNFAMSDGPISIIFINHFKNKKLSARGLPERSPTSVLTTP